MLLSHVTSAGFVTSGLELWQGEECAQSYFRQRLWGTLSMAQTLLADRACWMRHMKLDPATGDVPRDGFRVHWASSVKPGRLCYCSKCVQYPVRTHGQSCQEPAGECSKMFEQGIFQAWGVSSMCSSMLQLVFRAAGDLWL